MAICDSNYCFRIINVGSYGKESDCNVFKMSPFGKKLYSDKTNFPPERCLPGDDQGVPQPFILVADEAFALNKNLLRPFPDRMTNDGFLITVCLEPVSTLSVRLEFCQRNGECFKRAC
ncbi:unnamed protein product [Macrosiphum euphorbiae]|uniref:DDE Tnp4 domain-containing protein n=1 Tax=Macrosiphum euphorbiae TaxID=13131 RepID=A0AAV0VQT9_9HEMI|nr:unnamed protein product [Macrosiphum euphorbiae]